MNFIEICLARFSARKYTDQPVSDEDLTYILESLQAAPSAVNRQPWKFVVVKSQEARERLQLCYDRDWFKSAPLYIIAYKNKNEEYPINSIYNACFHYNESTTNCIYPSMDTTSSVCRLLCSI